MADPQQVTDFGVNDIKEIYEINHVLLSLKGKKADKYGL